jgi:hypothetical protein
MSASYDVHWSQWAALIESSDASQHERMIAAFPPANIERWFTPVQAQTQVALDSLVRDTNVAVNESSRTLADLDRIDTALDVAIGGLQNLKDVIQSVRGGVVQRSLMIREFGNALGTTATSGSRSIGRRVGNQADVDHQDLFVTYSQ